MQHRIPVPQIGPLGDAMAGAVQACVHCGFCLPTCPTYQVLGQEMDSPRGRIYLMKEVLEGKLPADKAMPHIDACLGCMACETACPSGVRYHDLLSPFRERVQRGWTERLRRALTLNTLTSPRRFRLAARLGILTRPLRRLLPSAMRAMLDLLPDHLPAPLALPERTPAHGPRRARVALLAGCAQQVLDPDINAATIAVLARNGVEVVIPRAQVCCGSLAWHTGDGELARRLARTNLDAFPADVDAVVTNASGCGSGMHDYALMFTGTPLQEAAARFSARVMDVSAFLDRLGLASPPPEVEQPLTVAYHDACHLCHAQGVRAAPRRLLAAIPNVTLVELGDDETCCGSAGTYNIDQPAIAAELGRRKARRVLDTGAALVATGNIGCMVQLRAHLAQLTDSPPPVVHTMQLLASAYAKA